MTDYRKVGHIARPNCMKVVCESCNKEFASLYAIENTKTLEQKSMCKECFEKLESEGE